jgi:serine/threonine protein kinase
LILIFNFFFFSLFFFINLLLPLPTPTNSQYRCAYSLHDLYYEPRLLNTRINLQSNKTQLTKLVKELMSALEFLHLKGVVHGDLRPRNVLFLSNGVLKLSDFGLARQVHITHRRRCGSMHFFTHSFFFVSFFFNFSFIFSNRQSNHHHNKTIQTFLTYKTDTYIYIYIHI